MSKNEIIETLRSLDRDASENYRAKILGVFGSVARGEEGPDSDVDVLVEFLVGATLLDLSGLGLFLEEKIGLPVDIVPIDTIKLELKEQILSEAILV
jgi:predicted nucleotidyltransferase